MKQIVLKTTKVPVVVNIVDGKYFVRGDTSKNNGCLHYTHEWEISFEMRNSNLNFLGGWEISASDIEYCAGKDGYELFNYLHPGILEDLQNYIKHNC